MFTRTKPKTQEAEHKIEQKADKDIHLSSKPTDGSHRTITDNTKNPDAPTETTDPATSDKPVHEKKHNDRKPREPKDKDAADAMRN